MDKLNIEKIINLDNKFYKDVAEEFSKTRKGQWDAWPKLLEILNKNFTDYQSIKIIDLGCGNGRFYAFLKENIYKNVEYLGLDNNDYLLIEALLRYKTAAFKNVDVITNLESIREKYDLVTIFGLAHHIPGTEFRLTWLNQVATLVEKNGFLIISFWDLNSDDRFNKANKAEDLEDNDYYYGWGETEFIRYVHLYSNDELDKMIKCFEDVGLHLHDNFSSDGKNKHMNKYFVFKKDK